MKTSAGFGDPDSVGNILGPNGDDSTALGKGAEYFRPMVKELEKKFGYQSYIDLVAAPYDWRYAPG